MRISGFDWLSPDGKSQRLYAELALTGNLAYVSVIDASSILSASEVPLMDFRILSIPILCRRSYLR